MIVTCLSSEFMDFMPLSMEICFLPSVDSSEVSVSIVADDIFEASSGEMFLLRLSGRAYPVQVNIVQSVASIIIVEDPSKYVLTLVIIILLELVHSMGL